MWRVFHRFINQQGHALTDDLLCFASSAITHALLLLAALSIPPGMNWQRVEPIRPVLRSVSLVMKPPILHEMETLSGAEDNRQPGTIDAKLEVGQLGDSNKDGPPQIDPTGTRPAHVGALIGEGRKYMMYCFGCSDCDTNPKHPGCTPGSVEVIESATDREDDWSTIVRRALHACQGLPGDNFEIRASALGWVAVSTDQGRCVAAHLPIFQQDVWTPSLIRFTDGEAIDIVW